MKKINNKNIAKFILKQKKSFDWFEKKRIKKMKEDLLLLFPKNVRSKTHKSVA